MKITILGCGASGGVPLIGPHWGACDSREPKNWRRRSSILIEDKGCILLVDATPDVRMQLIDAGISHVDALLLTHSHADHINGLDDMRMLNNAMQRPIALYATKETFEEVKQRFPYIFRTPSRNKEGRFFKPCFISHIITIGKTFSVNGLDIVPVRQDHGVCQTVGFRYQNMAYSPDVVRLPEESLAQLRGLSLWIVDCLREKPSPTHAHLERVIKWTNSLKPKHVLLTHMSHESDYSTLKHHAPKPIEPAWDGMVVEL